MALHLPRGRGTAPVLTSRQDDQLCQTYNDMSHLSKIYTVTARSNAMVKVFDLSNLKGALARDFRH